MMTLLLSQVEENLSVAETITPFLPLIGTIVGAIVVGIFAVFNRKRGAIETRAPDVNEIWSRQAADQVQLDMERRLRRMLEDLVRDLRRAFRVYVTRVQSGGKADLTQFERQMYEASIPTQKDLTPE